ncbi:MAG: hypothetical protein RJA29_2291, partial [Pseudomonadota bacterium]
MSTDTTPLVELRDLQFGYNDRLILDGVSLCVPRGKVTALMGASGGGKTTVLRLMGGQVRAQSGQVLFDGQDVGSLKQEGLYALRRRMGMLFQFGALFTDLNVFDNVAFPLREHTDLDEALIRDIVLMKLEAVGLRGARDLKPSEVSGGMARRVALARAIALDPELVMYDEPFAGLDPISLGTAARLIRQLNDSLGLTSVVVSHDLDETFHIADQVIILANGRVAAQGTPQQVRASQDPLVHQFVSAAPEGPVRFHFPAASVEEDLDAIARGEQGREAWLQHFYFGALDHNGNEVANDLGLKRIVANNLDEIDAAAINTFILGKNPADGEDVFVKPGKFGPYVRSLENTAGVPDTMTPEDLTLEVALQLLAAPKGDEPIGQKDGFPVFAKTGRYGAYVQWGTPDNLPPGLEKPKMVSLFATMNVERLSMKDAEDLLSLPRTVGHDPADGEIITAQNGRFGPYISKGKESRSIDSEDQIFTITLEEALAKLAEPRVYGRRGPAKPPL